MDKSALRRTIREKKRAMTDQQIESASAELAERLFAHPAYQQAKALYGYLSYNQEVRTAAVLERAQWDGKRVAVPKVYGDEMKFLWLEDLAAVAPGAREALQWAVGEGILQGTQANTLDPEGTATRAQLAVMADRFLTLRPAA